MTLANRILRLYCSDPKPSLELKMLVRFLIDVYCPAWFDVVQNPSFLDGPRIFHRLGVSLDAFPFKVQARQVMEASIDWNSYFAHPENVLLSMLTDQAKPELRMRAANFIRSIKINGKPAGVRDFIKPKVNWKAKSYEQLIKDLKPEEMTLEPPVPMDLSPEEVDAAPGPSPMPHSGS